MRVLKRGVYVSFDDGDNWQSLQLDLPNVPVTDLTVKDGDLIASTQGRAFWILDDVTPLEQMTEDVSNTPLHVFKPRAGYRVGRGRGSSDSGLIVDYYLAQTPSQPVTIEFQDGTGKAIKTFTSSASRERRGESRGNRPQGGQAAVVTAAPGLNRFVWDMAYPDAHGIDGGTFLLGGSLRGPQVIPGEYKVKVSFGDQSAMQIFEIKKDPRAQTSLAAYRKQLDLLLAARDKLSATDDAINQIRKVEQQVDAATKQAAGNALVADSAHQLEDQLNLVLHKLYEPRFTGYDDQTLDLPAAAQQPTRGDAELCGWRLRAHRPGPPGIRIALGGSGSGTRQTKAGSRSGPAGFQRQAERGWDYTRCSLDRTQNRRRQLKPDERPLARIVSFGRPRCNFALSIPSS